MFITKNLVVNVKDISPAWVFSFYCNLPIDRFDGTDFKIKSPFNNTDTVPSFSLYTYKGNYKFNDFSTGKKGTYVNLVQELFHLSYGHACNKIINDYNTWILNGGSPININITVKEKYKVTDYKIRNWNTLDKDYWLSFNIGSKILDRYFVRPLSEYQMDNQSGNPYTFSYDYIYGYFMQDGSLYKIYQPYCVDRKFIKVKDYIQGSEQVEMNPYLIYLSSLKDIMSFASLKLKMDAKAPDSENTIICKEDIEFDKLLYKKLLVLFDNDDPGIKAAKKYEELYNIKATFLNYGEKDLSDHFKVFGAEKTARWLIPLINKHIN